MYDKKDSNSAMVVQTNQRSKFTNKNFRILLNPKKVVHSQSRKENFYDNIFCNPFIEH